MHFHKEYLDWVLVPGGLLIMFGYHLFLLYRYMTCPTKTAIGHENHDKRAWVTRIVKMDAAEKEKKEVWRDALAVIGSNLNASTFLATVSLTLSSIIGAWIVNSSDNVFESELIYGDRRLTTLALKYISLLACFLVAFAFFVQAARHFVLSNYLISMPDNNTVEAEDVMRAVEKGGNYWTLGLRSLYLALDMLLWFFGPIPMFMGSVVTVLLLTIHDTKSSKLQNYGPSVPTIYDNIKRKRVQRRKP